ncbi:hypothetical protein [Zafaria cholistanensis]|uniref:hypothetical protein n=1 Tax=Zafaria cholistanensis TaxID=1682741 RepID=UPI0012309707|nr:hypothetical protein [Zafaria cholistanensis]
MSGGKDQAHGPARDAASGAPARPERSSQQRARDREVLRELRRLEQVAARSATREPGDAAQDQKPLTRRQLRPRPSATGAVAAAPATGPVPVVRGGAAAPATGPVPVVRGSVAAPSTGSIPAVPGMGEEPVPRTGSMPVLSKTAKTAKPVKVGPSTTQDAPSGNVSLEDALAARRRSAARMAAVALPPASADDSVFDEDSGLIDLEVLARQRELAARAAIISRRAAERQRLEQANSMRMEKVRSDPFTGALMQVRDPQAEKMLANIGVRGPETSGFRLDLSDLQPTGEVRQARQPETAPAEPADAVPQPRPAVVPLSGEDEDERAFGFSGALGRIRSGIAADRDLAPQDDDDPNVQPVRAVRAQGLDPLDYLTAGVRRANHTVMLTAGSVTAGGGAFVAGIVMIFTAR